MPAQPVFINNLDITKRSLPLIRHTYFSVLLLRLKNGKLCVLTQEAEVISDQLICPILTKCFSFQLLCQNRSAGWKCRHLELIRLSFLIFNPELHHFQCILSYIRQDQTEHILLLLILSIFIKNAIITSRIFQQDIRITKITFYYISGIFTFKSRKQMNRHIIFHIVRLFILPANYDHCYNQHNHTDHSNCNNQEFFLPFSIFCLQIIHSFVLLSYI